ncbi:MAG TPA: ABC transporter substrate-binding protein [Candidatus Polarisedimenticolaceae bacterium]|nr:ABC transporter substrate-binding protein [Candidatus Polarisedimenticolaceae bacterium]
MLRVLGLVPCLAGLLACPSAQADRQTAQALERQRGGTLRLRLEVPQSLDPLGADSVYESLPIRQVFEGLVATDAGLNIVPALAATWTISRDGRTYVLHLREGVRFHDSVPLAADDVVFTFERALRSDDPGNLARPYLSVLEGADAFAAGRTPGLAGVRALDGLTVQIQLARPYSCFLEVLAMDGLRVVPRHAFASTTAEGFGRAPVGTGPFRFQTWDDAHLVLARNTDYWGETAWLDDVSILFQEEGDRLDTDRLLAGEVDVAEVRDGDLERLREPQARVLRFQELSVAFLGLLTRTPPLDDVRIRQAIACAIDRDALVADAPLLRRKAVGILPPGLPGYSPDPKVLPYDPDRARALLALAGKPGGRGLPPIDLYTSGSSAAATRVIELIRQDLADVGINVQVHIVPWGEMSTRLQEKTAPAFMLGWVADLADPDAFLRALFQSDVISNLFAFEDEQADTLLDAGAREMHPVRRVHLYREAESRILQLAPLVPLYHSSGLLATSRRVRDFDPGPMGLSAIDLRHVWLSSPEATR